MKRSTLISIVAFVLAAIALVLSTRPPKPIDQAQIELAADEALRKREKEFVEEFRPRFQMMFADMGDEFDKNWDPQTIDELIEPLTIIINDMTDE